MTRIRLSDHLDLIKDTFFLACWGRNVLFIPCTASWVRFLVALDPVGL